MDRLVRFYRRLSTTARSVIVFVLAVSVALATMHALTFSATAITKKTGEEDPGIVLNQDPENEDFDNVSEGTGTDNPEEKPSEPAETPAAPEVQEGEPSPEPSAMPEEPGTEPEVTAAPEETGAPEETEAPEEVIIAEEEQSGAELLSEEPEEESDPTADIETAADWEKLFRDIEFTGVWADDLLAVAESQIGYRESKANFIRDEENIKRGYTRYGAWYGDAYAKWDSLFVLFSMYYTGITIDQFPFKSDCEDWIEALKEKELFFEADDYVPNKGDLVFADTDEDGEADYVAIVKAVETKEGESDKLVVIEGDSGDEVKESRHEFNNPLILGYAQLPENPELAEEEEPEAEPVYASFEGKANNVEVTVLYEEGAFPEGTTMKVKPVWNPSVLGAINDTVTDKEVVKVQAVDIAFYDAEGKEIEPEKPIKVTMKSTSVPKQAEEAPVVVHVDDKMETSVVEAEQAEEAENPAEAVTFEAGAFSVYAIVYTVDFAYALDGHVYTFSMEGGTSMKLSALVEALGIIEETSLENGKAFVAEVQNVEFTDSTLLKVKKDFFGNDWTLTSLAPFTSQEALTITMNNGNVFTIDVTDAQAASSTDLKDFIANASISAPTNSEGKYVITPDTSYDISLSFAENPTLQYDNHQTLTYDLSNSGLDFSGLPQNGEFSIKINDGGVFYTITGNKFSIDENGHLTVNFNTNDPHYNNLAASSNLRFTLNLDAKVKSDATKIVFSDGVEKEIEVDNSNSVTASKSATFNKETGTIDYSVAIVSQGASKNVVVKDTITGEALTLDASSIHATSSTGQPVSMTGSPSGNSFQYTIESMKNNEVVTFNYSAKIDMSKIHYVNGKYESTGTNKVEVSSEGDPTPDVVERTTVIDYTPNISKGNGEVIGESGNKKTIQWTITANDECKVSMAGGKITDIISDNSKDIMKYSGPGITVTVYDAGNNVVRTDNVGWDDNSITKTDSTWTYTVPSSDLDKAYKYVITYTTEVDVTGKNTSVKVDNKVETDGGQTSSGGSDVPPPAGNTVKAEKLVHNVDVANKEVTWNIVFNVPDTGLSTATIKDYYPYRNDNKSIREKVIRGSVSVSGLVGGETYDVDYDQQEGDRLYALITFFRDQSHSASGLKPGSPRTVTVTLKTELNEQWIKDSSKPGLEWLMEHENNAHVVLGDYEDDIKKTVIITSPAIKKDSAAAGFRNVDGVELPVYQYKVRLTDVSSADNVIKDTFDTTLLEVYNGKDDAFYTYAGNQYTTWLKSSQPASYVNTADGIEIHTDSLSIEKDKNGEYHKVYDLVYYLTVKDETALKTIMGRAATADGGKYTMNNTATWNGLTDGAEVTYEYKGLNKELLTNPEDLKKTDEDIWANFRITLNPGGLMLNGGEPLTMTDTINNLSIDYNSIQATPSEGVTWDQTDSVTTFTIPDQTKVVITYKARVLFKTIGDQGETVKVEFNNVAEMEGFRDEVSGSGERHNSGGGAGSVAVINLLKYRAGNMKDPLPGAVFALLNENKEPITWGKDFEEHRSGDPVQFTTGTDGLITVRGDAENYGWNLEEDTRYYLREITAPEGYMLADFDYSFKISSDGTTDYSDPEWKYHNGDTMSAKNYPGTDVKVYKQWSDGNEKHTDDSVTVKLQQKIGTADWSDTVYSEEKNQQTGKYEWVRKTRTLELNSGNEWYGLFASLPLVAPQNPAGLTTDDVDVQYRVVETLVNNEAPEEGTVTVTESKDGGAYVFTVANTVLETTGSLKLKKLVTVDDKSIQTSDTDARKKLTDGKYVFTVTNTEDTTDVHTVSISYSNGVVASAMVDNAEINPLPEDGYIEIKELSGTTYTIAETNKPKGSSLVSAVRADGSEEAVVDGVVTVVVTPGKKEADVQNDAKATFTNNVKSVTAKIIKVWKDIPQTVSIPDSLKVTLSNGTEVNLTAANNWSATIKDLPKVDTTTGEEITYHWTEGSLPAGFYLANFQEETGADGVITTTLTNSYSTHYNPTTSIFGKKIWDDNGSEDRPHSITVKLLKDGNVYQTATVQAPTAEDADKDQWPFEFTNLPVFNEDGSLVVYTVKEVLPDGYTSVYGVKVEFAEATYIAGDAEATIINTYSSENKLLCQDYNLGFIVIRHGNSFVVWTPRPLQDGELSTIKDAAVKASEQFNGIMEASGSDLKVISGVPMTIDVGKKHAASVKIIDGDVYVNFLSASAQSDIVYGTIPYTYTAAGGEGGGTITNTKQVTDFEFGKKWLNDSCDEVEWDQDIEVTVSRKLADGTTDSSFSLTYSITKKAVENAEDGKAEFATTGGPNDPKLQLTITESSGKKKYTFALKNLDYIDDEGGKYIYYVEETNEQLSGYLEPKYENVNAPTGGTEAYNKGTIINQTESGVVLPKTGGSGTGMITILGSILILLGAGVLLLRRRGESL